MSEQRYLILDYETRSEADLRRTGGYEYANHPTTKILCVSWRLGTRAELLEQIKQKLVIDGENSLTEERAKRGFKDEPFLENRHRAKIWSPAFPKDSDDPGELIHALLDPTILLVAHNAIFEQVITRFVFSRFVKDTAHTCNEARIRNLGHDRWICTASMAAALALPRNLEGACAALKLPVQKDTEGRRLMLKYSKPRKPTKNNPSRWFSSARDLRRIMTYCQTDVDAETMLFLTAPPLSAEERRVWLLDQKINFRGFEADREMVKSTLRMIAEETINLNRETTVITNGTPGSTTQRDGVLKWLQSEGVFLPNLRAKTVADAIEAGLVEGEAKRLLEIRQSVSKTSTKKYAAFETRSRSDGRVRDILVYHTASTGRWGGSGVQPQNFPRGTIADTVLAADILREGDLELVRLIYGNPMAVFSSCLRSVIRAPTDKELFCADYAAIEARVLFWVAKHEAGLKSFRQNVPMYEQMAMVIYALETLDMVTKLQRQVGKQSFLGCGFGMGWKKFLQTCKSFGIEVDEETAQVAVKAYRSLHAPVVKLWSNLDKAAIEATKRPGTKFKINRTTWWVEALPKNPNLKFLWCELPSGRRLAYFRPQVKYEKTPWDEKRAVLYHEGVNPITRKWESSGTYGGRLAENVVQAISRDLMAAAMLRVEDAGYEVVLTVHDEILAERQKDMGAVEDFCNLMGELPAWAEEVPIAVEGWSGSRYRK